MFRMSHPDHGYQMVQAADKPMFDRAGWSVVVDTPDDDAAGESEPEQPRKRGRPRKVTPDADSL